MTKFVRLAIQTVPDRIDNWDGRQLPNLDNRLLITGDCVEIIDKKGLLFTVKILEIGGE